MYLFIHHLGIVCWYGNTVFGNHLIFYVNCIWKTLILVMKVSSLFFFLLPYHFILEFKWNSVLLRQKVILWGFYSVFCVWNTKAIVFHSKFRFCHRHVYCKEKAVIKFCYVFFFIFLLFLFDFSYWPPYLREYYNWDGGWVIQNTQLIWVKYFAL